jgi:hypothetical protein
MYKKRIPSSLLHGRLRSGNFPGEPRVRQTLYGARDAGKKWSQETKEFDAGVAKGSLAGGIVPRLFTTSALLASLGDFDKAICGMRRIAGLADLPDPLKRERFKIFQEHIAQAQGELQNLLQLKAARDRQPTPPGR